MGFDSEFISEYLGYGVGKRLSDIWGLNDTSIFEPNVEMFKKILDCCDSSGPVTNDIGEECSWTGDELTYLMGLFEDWPILDVSRSVFEPEIKYTLKYILNLNGARLNARVLKKGDSKFQVLTNDLLATDGTNSIIPDVQNFDSITEAGSYVLRWILNKVN